MVRDKAYQGVGGPVRVPFRGRRLKRWKRRHHTTHAKIRCLGEQAMATLKGWRLLRKLRCSTNRVTDVAKGGIAPGGPQDAGQVSARWRSTRTRLELPERFRIHDWWRSKVTNDLDAGENPVEVSANVRHHSPGYAISQYGERRVEGARKLASGTAQRIGLRRIGCQSDGLVPSLVTEEISTAHAALREELAGALVTRLATEATFAPYLTWSERWK